MPYNVTLFPEMILNTGEPLSPPFTAAFTQFWQSKSLFVPETAVSTQVAWMGP